MNLKSFNLELDEPCPVGACLIQVENFDFYKMSKVILLFIWTRIIFKRIEQIIMIEFFQKVDPNICNSVSNWPEIILFNLFYQTPIFAPSFV